MFDITQFRADILIPSLEALQLREPNFAELLVFTCATESQGGAFIKQVGGNALGIYQIEPNTFTELWYNYIIRKPDVVNMLSLNLNINRMPTPYEIMTNLSLATVLCALYYKWRHAPTPENDEKSLWAVYKEFYNTYEGKAEESTSIKAYRKFTKA